jgi:SOS-response transcriptional repressor LexA
MDADVRPSKKQRELLSFIDGFIKGHGYGPSYREVMRALNYSSVSTVATHINGLIKKGHLRKKDNSARTLEVVSGESTFRPKTAPISSDEKWLIDVVNQKFDATENATVSQKQLDNLFVLVGALHILGFKEATANLKPRLKALKQQIDATKK